jgi:hypothetical protein
MRTTAVIAPMPVVEVPAAASENAVEFDLRVSSRGALVPVPGVQQVPVPSALAGRTPHVWADLRSIHLLLNEHLLRTLTSRLLLADPAHLRMRGAQPAGPALAAAALPRAKG